MKSLSTLLKLLAPGFVLAGLLHLVLGLDADVMLGAKLTAETIADPALDSQNRFYGVTFTLYGILLYLCATDLTKYIVVLRCLLGVFFAAGLARVVSIAVYGFPPILIWALLASELLIPPVLIYWLSRLDQTSE